MFSFITSSLIGKILAGSVALAASGGTLAATGNLPDPVQTVVADIVDNIGIQIPRPVDAEEQLEVDEAVEPDEAAEADEGAEAAEADEGAEAAESGD